MNADPTDLAALPQVLTVDEAAKALRVGRSALYEAVKRGQIPACFIGRKIRISREALIAALDGSTEGRT